METQEEGKRVEKRMSPEYRAAMAGYIPISIDPIDRFTPDWCKEHLQTPKWPIVHIRKPGPLDIVQVMERQISEEAAKAKTIAAESAADQEISAVAERSKRLFLMRMGQEAIRTWRERVVKFENMTDAAGRELKWDADEKGVITDACLNALPWNMVTAVHFRYDSLFSLTEMEKEGLESQPASA
jgi:hypothetical protein